MCFILFSTLAPYVFSEPDLPGSNLFTRLFSEIEFFRRHSELFLTSPQVPLCLVILQRNPLRAPIRVIELVHGVEIKFLMPEFARILFAFPTANLENVKKCQNPTIKEGPGFVYSRKMAFRLTQVFSVGWLRPFAE